MSSLSHQYKIYDLGVKKVEKSRSNNDMTRYSLEEYINTTDSVQFSAMCHFFTNYMDIKYLTILTVICLRNIAVKIPSHFNPFNPTDRFSAIQDNVWKSPLRLLSVERVNKLCIESHKIYLILKKCNETACTQFVEK